MFIISRPHGACVAGAILAALPLVPASVAMAQQPFAVRSVGPESTAFTAVVSRPGDGAHAFALTRSGRVLVIENGLSFRATPLLDFSVLVASGGESGALGLAFDPDYASNGHFYIAHTTSNSNGTQPPYVLVRYTVSPPSALTADPASRTVIMPLTPAGEFLTNHQGGWIGFGPDGYLYITRGENPGSGTNAQNPDTIRGKVLRIDVRSDAFPDDPLSNYAIPPGNPFAGAAAGADEVFALGLRNPWRASFDRATGHLWIGDVGSSHEEINVLPAAAAAPMNFGWPCYDGNGRAVTSGLCANPTGLTTPLVEFSRSGNAIPALNSTCLAGGVVYRGCEVPALVGRFLYGGCTGGPLSSFNIADPAGTAVTHTAGLGLTLGAIYTFGEDAHGEVYIGTSRGLFRIGPLAGTFTDCNGNGRDDACEVADGSTPDANNDGLPDTCTRLCPADMDANGQLTVGDLFFFLANFFSGRFTADINDDGQLSVQDIFDFLAIYFGGCS